MRSGYPGLQSEANSSQDSILKKSITKKGLAEWLMVKSLSSHSRTTKKLIMIKIKCMCSIYVSGLIMFLILTTAKVINIVILIL
jgi:hypothetical protein